MAYPYGTQGAPATGNGLGGLPRRALSSVAAAAAPVFQDFAVVLVGASPFVHVYKRVGDSLVAVNAADHGLTLSSNARNGAFSPSGRYLAIALNNGTRNIFRIWKCNKGVFTFLTDIDETWTYTTYFPTFSADDRFFAGGTNESDTVKNCVAYRIDTATDTFTRLADLSNQVSGTISSPALSSDGTYLAVGRSSNANGGGIQYYKFNGTSFVFLTSLNGTNPSRHPAFSSDDSMSLFLTDDAATNKIFTVSRSGDTFALSTQFDTGASPGAGMERYQLNVRNNYFLWNQRTYLTFSPTGLSSTAANGYSDPFNACPNADASYLFSTGYNAGGSLRLTKRTGVSTITQVADTGALTGGSNSGSSLASRVTVATVRMN